MVAQAEAATKSATKTSVHTHVGKMLKKLRGTSLLSDFARKCCSKESLLLAIENGEATCLGNLKFIAVKNNQQVEFFFPDGIIPEDYPEH
ncbi:MAG: hypothetical protein JWL87_312 [Candidatus Adlerbacteria bacterium]|nr:hypothetical protein [Candidatus Adlerbacteria bacterium]